MKQITKKLLAFFSIILLSSACSAETLDNNRYTLDQNQVNSTQETVQLESLPTYTGNPYIVVNDNQPSFSDESMTTESFESYADLDALGRCGVAYANLGQDLMPTEDRGDISEVKPSGWNQAFYDLDGDGSTSVLYNRCHLIGFQLAGENANEKNLITGTRYMNVDGMLPFENMVADYIKETNYHVLYRVSPIYDGDNLVASGVQMEAKSVEDNGEGILFNVYVYNVQPGISIDYSTGASQQDGTSSSNSDSTGTTSDETACQGEIRGNRRSKIYHCQGQQAYDDMEHSNNLVVFATEQEAIDAGYRKAKR